jgi:putative ABC transport system permease protein
MLKNYIIVAYRNLIRHRFFSFINLAGLALGISASLLLFYYTAFELSYDKFHENADNIYRIRLDTYKGGALENSSAISYYGESPAIKESFPQVENYVRLHKADGMLNYCDENGTVTSHYERTGLYADSSFFSIFSFPLVMGDRHSVLRSPNSMLMSESASKKYFGSTNPIGKVIKFTTEWQGGDYVVEGVFKDIPANSHFKFDFLFSIEKLLNNNQFKNRSWYWTNFYNYLLLKPGTNVKELETEISSVIVKFLGQELKKSDTQQKFVLEPMTEIHLRSNIMSEIDVNGNHQIVYFLIIAAFLIMSIAWLNYLNLSTARAIERAKEVGIRKVMGSEKPQLIRQFLFESLILSLAAVAIASILVLTLRPYFLSLVGKEITLNFFIQIKFWGSVVAVLALGTFLAGFYPAWISSSFQPIAALKGRYFGTSRGALMRKSMVIMQFSASVLLIITTLTIRKQINFMHGQDLGMTINQKLIIRAPKIIQGESYLGAVNSFKNELEQYPGITHVTASSEVPGKEIFWTNEFRLKQSNSDERRILSVMAIDQDFLDTYDIKLLAGRNFSEKRPADYGGPVILNETAMEVLGINNPELAIDQEVETYEARKIIGVIKDFQQQSLKKSNVPILLQFIPWKVDYFTVSLSSQNVAADIDRVIESYKKIFPENAIEYFFLDDFFNKQYKSEEEFLNIFKVASMLAIFIACIGLFGLSSFIISKRTKEIGIRKVLGGSEIGIVSLLSKDFVKLVILAIVVAIPLASFVTDSWLSLFAHRIDISVWTYIVAGGIAIAVALLTVSIQAIRAALASPVNSIRTE